jgi:hypothetical protein
MKINKSYGISHNCLNLSAYFQPYIREFDVSQHTPGQSTLKYASLPPVRRDPWRPDEQRHSQGTVLLPWAFLARRTH